MSCESNIFTDNILVNNAIGTNGDWFCANPYQVNYIIYCDFFSYLPKFLVFFPFLFYHFILSLIIFFLKEFTELLHMEWVHHYGLDSLPWLVGQNKLGSLLAMEVQITNITQIFRQIYSESRTLVSAL